MATFSHYYNPDTGAGRDIGFDYDSSDISVEESFMFDRHTLEGIAERAANWVGSYGSQEAYDARYAELLAESREEGHSL